MLQNINFQIWFKVCRPLRRKFNISTNVCLILNGAYVLSLVNNKPFTRYQLRKFTSYYNNLKLDSLINICISKGFLISAESNNTRDYYILSSSGLSVIKELNNSYEIELRKFIDCYSIVL